LCDKSSGNKWAACRSARARFARTIGYRYARDRSHHDAVLITAIEALLKGAGIRHMVLDQNMSVLEGSLGMLPRRILVEDDSTARARRVLTDAGLAHELRPMLAEASTTEDAVLKRPARPRQPRRGHRFWP